MLEKLNNIIKTDFFNNVLFDWGIFILTFLAIFIVLKILKNFIYKKLERFSQKHQIKLMTISLHQLVQYQIFYFLLSCIYFF